MLRIGPSDVSGVFGFPVTPAVSGAESWRSSGTVDVDAQASTVRKLVDAGVGGIAVMGTTGEGMNLTLDEFRTTVDVTVEAVGGRIPVFAGVTGLNTRDAVERGRYVHARGAGILSGLPMWQELSQQNAIQFYKDLAEAFPDTSVMVYENPVAFRVTFAAESWQQLSRIPNVVAAKVGTDPTTMINALRLVGHDLRLMPIDRLLPTYSEYGAGACWSTDVALGPWAVLAMARACQKGELARAREIQAEFLELDRRFGIPLADIHRYSSSWHKLTADAAGWSRGGATRPPLVHVPREVVEKALLFGREYARLAEKYRSSAATDARVPSA